MQDLSSNNRGGHPVLGPLQWKLGVLTTGPPGNSLYINILKALRNPAVHTLVSLSLTQYFLGYLFCLKDFLGFEVFCGFQWHWSPEFLLFLFWAKGRLAFPCPHPCDLLWSTSCRQKGEVSLWMETFKHRVPPPPPTPTLEGLGQAQPGSAKSDGHVV